MAILGLDVGGKRIGVALSTGLIAVPLTVIESAGGDEDFNRVLALADEYDAERIVVGLPRSMDGSIGSQAESVIEFSKGLAKRTDIPIDTCDERLTTVTAERLLREGGARRGKRKANIDAMAASVILQAYIDETNK
ncbi:MAG: Holliday junction resolvase RuvX [Chloroflexota bacterium]|nr:Holliday junction resolvase RuvX [Chloroflexota bacterium]